MKGIILKVDSNNRIRMRRLLKMSAKKIGRDPEDISSLKARRLSCGTIILKPVYKKQLRSGGQS